MTPSGLFAGLQGSGAADGDGSLAAPPPPYFREAFAVRSAWFGEAPVDDKPAVGYAKKAGLRYEKKVQDFLRRVLPPELHINPWLEFIDIRGKRWCRPDALWLPQDRADIFIVEIKLQHMPEAYWQLRHLYLPVVRRLLPNGIIHLVEICKSYDPAMPFPEGHVLLNAMSDAWDIPSDKIGVFPWKA